MAQEKDYILLSDLTYHVEEEPIFKDLSLRLDTKNRIGIVGINGAGKTTLFRVLRKELEPTGGTIEWVGSLRLGYVEQVHDSREETVLESLSEAFPEILKAEKTLRTYEAKIAEGDVTEDTLHHYGDAQETYMLLGGYQYHNNIHQMLTGLTFPKKLWEAPLKQLSGGERTRVALAKMLLTEPDIMLLDEPTNFLDMEAVEWLEWYLVNRWKKGLLVISHDRYFLDRVTTETLEMIPGRTPEQYSFPYSKYVIEKEKRKAIQWKHFEKQEEEIMRQTEIVNRLRAGSRASLAQSRIKMLDKIERLEKPQEEKRPIISFKRAELSSDIILRFREVFVGYSKDHPLYMMEEVHLDRGQKVAILGPNGAGKSTLLKTILGDIDLLGGTISTGKNIHRGYYAQGHEHLEGDATIMDEVWKEAVGWSREQIRTFLGAFLFSGDEVFKKIKDLSGGERARVALAKLSLSPTNFLILDEPTNHLDYLAREALEPALQRYAGTVLMISHDRYFIDRIATHLWIIENEEIKVFHGNYTEYKEWVARGSAQFASKAQEEGELLLADLEKAGDLDELEKRRKGKKKKKK